MERCATVHKKLLQNIATADKKLVWMKPDLQSAFHQFSYYDREPEVSETVSEAAQWFSAKLK
jgi:hypothetical protein